MKSLYTRFLLASGALALLTQGVAQGQTTLFSDSFDTDTSSNWDVFDGSASGTPDYTVLFAFNYSTNRFTRNGVTGTIPPAPNGGGTGVKMWVNKNDATAEIAAVSLYPKGKTFSGEYALRFDMWLNYNGDAGGGTGSTEFATFGIDHMGDKVNWADGVSPSDGIWFAVTGEGGAAQDYRAYYGDGFSPAYRLQGSLAFLDRDGDGVVEEEVVAGTQAPDYPLTVMFPSPEFETAGMPSKRWVEGEVRQRTNEFGGYTVTWLLNNYVVAEHSSGDTIGLNSGNVMIGNMDIFSSIANPAADNYVIYDNVRVLDLSSVPRLPVLTVSTNDGTAAEPADPGSVTITRFGDASSPLVVGYKLLGTAVNGVDYATLPGSLLLAAGQTSTNVTITPINDSIGENDESIIFALVGSTNYDIYTNISATISLLDDGDVPVAILQATKTNAYEGNPNNDARFTVNLSNPSSSPVTVNFTLGGTAVAGTDFTAVGTSVVIPAGETNGVIRIQPINNTVVNGARTVTITLGTGTGYVLGTTTSGTAGIRDDDFLPAGTLVYSENFDTDHTADWTVNSSGADSPVDLIFDYSSVGIPSAPNSTGGSTIGAKLQANLSGGVFGGVSISPVVLNLTGNYALRFDLWQSYNGPAPDGGSGSTQLSGAGVGTQGTTPQWPGGTQDSVWFACTGDGGSSIDYRAYSSAAPTGYVETDGVFAAGNVSGVRNSSHAYYYEFGLNSPPADQTAMFPNQTGSTYPGAPAFVWRDIVIQKMGNTVTWYMDGKLLAAVPADATNFAGGNIALLHSDINASSSSDIYAATIAFGLFDNVRVYQLASQPTSRPTITDIDVLNGGTTVQIDFSGESLDTTTSFVMQSSANAEGTYQDATGAVITQISSGKFRAVLPASGARQFYRVRR
jgi:hypothetical protein